MSGASKTNSPLVLYAEGVDPEADLVLVCGGRKFYVRRAVCEMAFPVVADSPDKSNGAEFDILGHSAETVEKLLLLVNPDSAIALTPKLITEVLPLAHFLGADALIQSFYLFLEANIELKSNVATAAFALDKLLAKEPKWSDRILDAMVRIIIPSHPMGRTWDLRQWEERQREKLVKERTPLLKGLHASTTMALFQRVAIIACEKNTGRINKTIHDIGT